MRNFISLYLFLAVLLTSYLATYVLSKGKSYYIKVFSVFSICVSLYLFGYVLELNSTTFEQMVFWNLVQYFGLPFIPGLWLLVALLYTKKMLILRERTLVWLLLIPVLTFFIRLTNSLHYLYYTSLELQQNAVMPLLYLQKGPWYYVHGIYILIALIIINFVLYREYRNSSRWDQTRFRVLLVASGLPYIGLMLTLVNFLGLGLDYAALMMPVSLFLILFAIVKFDFLEIKTLARETMFENSSDAMVLLDKEFRVMDYNKAAGDFFSSLDITLQNGNLESILGAEHEMLEIFKRETPEEFQGGQKRTFEVSSAVILDTYDRNIGSLKSIRDITERKMMQERLKILATTDALSSLNNREHFMQLAQKEFERSKRYGHGFSVLMMDLDNFKVVNDTHGHAAGDAVIREVGRLINTNFRQIDIFGRLGGEEFAIVLTNTAIDDAHVAAEQFRRAVAEAKVVYAQKEMRMTISIGAACYFNEAESIGEILRWADEGLYESKKQGRNCTTVKCAG
ncbi:MAG: diguanylate cyclase [Dethiobacter sp.]|jgi:diguanylate cyclase (GGDEF)-like protein|nr:diguanylate cyclase [Dethiobacter sp.]